MHNVTAGRRKTPTFVRLHEVLDQALKDAKRGHVVHEDVEGWTPKRVSEWLSSCNPGVLLFFLPSVSSRFSPLS